MVSIRIAPTQAISTLGTAQASSRGAGQEDGGGYDLFWRQNAGGGNRLFFICKFVHLSPLDMEQIVLLSGLSARHRSAGSMVKFRRRSADSSLLVCGLPISTSGTGICPP